MPPFETTHKIMDLGHRHWWLKDLSKWGYCGTYPNRQMRLAQTDLCHLAQQHARLCPNPNQTSEPLVLQLWDHRKYRHQRDVLNDMKRLYQPSSERGGLYILHGSSTNMLRMTHLVLCCRQLKVWRGGNLLCVTNISHAEAKQNSRSSLFSFSLTLFFSSTFWARTLAWQAHSQINFIWVSMELVEKWQCVCHVKPVPNRYFKEQLWGLVFPKENSFTF